MLLTIQTALTFKGRKNASIARELEVTPATVTGWFSGRNPIPARKRAALDRAFGQAVDWPAYDAEFAAMARRSAPEPVAPAPRPAPPPQRPPVAAKPAAAVAPPAAPAPRPAEARQRPAAPAADGWGDQTPPKPPTPAPAPRRGLFSGLLSGGDDPTFGGLLG